MTPSTSRPKRVFLSRFAIASAATLSVLFVTLSVLELDFRRKETPQIQRILAALRRFVLDGQVSGYEGRPHTVYGRPAHFAGRNSLGFNDVEWSVERAKGVPRIACLGSSTTEGGNDFGREATFPFLLERALEARHGRDVEVLNFGLSGWTSAEELVNWFLSAQDYRPDLVILHEAANDIYARNYATFRTDYVHYRKPWALPCFGGTTRFVVEHSDLLAWRFAHREPPDLVKMSTRPPGANAVWDGRSLPLDTTRAFRRNVLSIARGARDQGARVVLATVPYAPQHDVDDPRSSGVWRFGMRQHNEILRELAREEGFILVDLARLVAEHPQDFQGLFVDLVHLQPEGNRRKAEEIDRVLASEWQPPFE